MVISLLTTPLKGLIEMEEDDDVDFRVFKKLEAMENPRFAIEINW